MIGMVTIFILIMGFLLLYRAVGESDRDRERRMESVVYGSSAERIETILGVVPTSCPADDLSHLEASFPEGWPAASVSVALERLAAETAERWIFPLDADDEAEVLCSAVEPRTEVGIGPEGTVIWSIVVLGSTPIDLPPWAEPGADDP